ncbi:Scr1 family TA system antitoxin-like transcriptional regulator [Pseudonocardia sp. NPDC049635]|uniref:Scr1 family TA system antitoxin-like transcriptional regulator n=1 Tax=Pseudonocardia sp. NPDC049635 TaxID=3155506 RepID=UPI003400E6F5
MTAGGNDGTAAAELAQLLRELRAARTPRTSQAAAGELAGFSQSKVARLESGALAPTPMDAGRLAVALGAARADVQRAIRLARDVHEQRAGFTPVRTVFTQRPGLGQRRWRHRERDAHTVTTFQTSMVPGLLQTEEYMRAIARSGTGIDAAAEDEFVRERVRRQVARAELPAVQLFTTGALTGASMPLDVRLAQLAHIAELERTRPAWEIGLVPDEVTDDDGRPVYLFPMAGIDLYEYPDKDPHAVLASLVGPGNTADPGAIDKARERLGVLRRWALRGEAMLGELARIGDRLRWARG